MNREITREIRALQSQLRYLRAERAEVIATDWGSEPHEGAEELKRLTERIERAGQQLERISSPEYAAAHERRLLADRALGH